MAILPEIKESLKRLEDIRKTALKEAKIKVVPESPEDMYQYEASNPNYGHITYHTFHGKCFEEGSRKLSQLFNYVFRKTAHIVKNNPLKSGLCCQFCNERPDNATFVKMQTEEKEKRDKRHIAYQTWVKKQLMLGKDITCRCESIGKPCPNRGRTLND